MSAALFLLVACPSEEGGAAASTFGGSGSHEPGPSAIMTTGGEADAGELVVRGRIQGDLPDVPVKVLVLWSIETSAGDGLYSFGDGAVDGHEFSVTIREPLPLEATFGGVIGVGMLVLVPLDLVVPDGVLDEDFEEQMLGIAGNNSVVWRPDPAVALPDWPWADPFPSGYACGHCVQSAEIDAFDGFAVGPCEGITIYVPAETALWCEWT
ncbi:hypothetical protein [Nannocystis pusilla]|uniref:hypothetical protein n=1 Tax=Nannocystis pusilla TaxID=889268 RepID=UPI003B7C1655